MGAEIAKIAKIMAKNAGGILTLPFSLIGLLGTFLSKVIVIA